MRVAILGLAGAVLLGALAGSASAQTPKLAVELEGGPIWQSYNDAEIPNDGTASRFSLYDLVGAGPWPGGRLYVTWNLNDRHGFRLLLAPFSLTETATPDSDLRFEGAEFAAGVPLSATYTFNSYRFSYRYHAYESSRASAWVGFTAKVRDATLALEQGSTESRKDNVGFVPLLHLAGEWRPADRWRVGLDADALAGGPGRAIDAAVKLGYDLNDSWTVQGGYRMVEGGADVEEVYSFAWLHSAVISLTWRR